MNLSVLPAMNIFQAIIYGIVQGLTEFLPISSSGHLLIVPKIMGWKDPGAAFTAVIQLGTMAAVLIYFRKDIINVGGAWFKSLVNKSARKTKEARLGWVIFVGTIPISIIGLLLKDFIESGARNLTILGCTLIIGGVLLEITDRLGKTTRKTEDAKLKDGWLIGFAQAAALIPGMSRSGSTITMARVLSFDRKEAARVSFLLSIPAVVLSGLFELPSVFNSHIDMLPVLVATAVSFFVGYGAIAFLLDWLGKHRLTIFSGYRLILGAAILITIAIR